MSTQEVIYKKRNNVAYLTINRPEKSNAINQTVRKSLISMLCEANEDKDIWAIVLTGAGNRAFCSGGDLKEANEIAKSGEKFPLPMAGTERNLYETMLETYKPTIAVLNGAAVGGGFELALACDLRIASDNAILGFPEAKRGMGANFGSVLLPKLVPRGIALELLYTGEYITAQESLKWGLVNKVVPQKDLDSTTEELVRKIVINAPLTLRRYKHVANKTWEMPVSQALRLDVGPNPYLSKDREEGIRAFVEKRQPNWTNE